MKKKLLYKHIKVALRKKWHSKRETILKIAKIGHNTEAIAHAQHSVWVKN